MMKTLKKMIKQQHKAMTILHLSPNWSQVEHSQISWRRFIFLMSVLLFEWILCFVLCAKILFKDATFCALPTGIKIIVEDKQCVQGNAFIDTRVFDSYELTKQVRFRFHLETVLVWTTFSWIERFTRFSTRTMLFPFRTVWIFSGFLWIQWHTNLCRPTLLFKFIIVKVKLIHYSFSELFSVLFFFSVTLERKV